MNLHHRFLLLIFIVIWILPDNAVMAQGELKILPLGNSITRGSMCVNGDIYSCERINDSEAIGYRHRLFNLLTSAGYNFDFVGNAKFGYSIMSDPDNAGFSGIRDKELADIIETGSSTHGGNITNGPYLETYPADVILLHIGTNDVLANDYNVSDIARLLDAVDDYENTHGHDVLVFIATVISQQNYSCNNHFGTRTFNDNLTSMVQNRINNGDKIVFIDMECAAGLNYYDDLVDQVHPNQTGYDKMGEYWFQRIDGFNNAPIVSQIPDQEVDRGTAFNTINLDNYVTDIEDNPQDITWTTIPSQPQNFNVSISSGRVATISPKDDQWSGSETIEFVATDNGKVITKLRKSDETIVKFTVNWIPEIVGQRTLNTPEDQSLVLSLNDLTILEPENAPADMSLSVLNGNNYTVDGTTIIPSPDYNGTLMVPVKLIADGIESEVYNLSVGITPVNDKPIINAQTVIPEILQDSCTKPDLSMLDVTDVDNNYPSDFSLQVLSGSYYNHSSNSVCPYPGYSGTLNVRMIVNDGTANSDVFLFEIVVISTEPVFILPDNLSATQDEAYSSSIELNHYAPETYTFSAPELPSWLDFDPSTKTLSGVPSNDHVGDNTVTIKAVNGESSADTSFIINVGNVNDPPVIVSEPQLVAKTGIEYNYVFTAEDIDPDDELVYTVDSKPGWATFNPATGLLSGTPTREETGIYNVILKVSDGEYVRSQNFDIEVQFNNIPPDITSDPEDTAKVNEVYTYGISASDSEQDPLSYFTTEIPGWMEFYPSSHVLIGTPTVNDAGKHLIIIGVEDGIDTTFQVYYLEVVFETSVKYSVLDGKVKVYPNPASEYIDIQIQDPILQGSEDLIFELIDLRGKTLIKREIESTTCRVLLRESNIGKGLYFYRIYNMNDAEDTVGVDKLIIR